MLWKDDKNSIRMQGFNLPRKRRKIVVEGFVFNGVVDEETKCILKRDHWKVKEIEAIGETLYFTLKKRTAEKTALTLKLEVVYPDKSLIWALERKDVQ